MDERRLTEGRLGHREQVDPSNAWHPPLDRGSRIDLLDTTGWAM